MRLLNTLPESHLAEFFSFLTSLYFSEEDFLTSGLWDIRGLSKYCSSLDALVERSLFLYWRKYPSGSNLKLHKEHVNI